MMLAYIYDFISFLFEKEIKDEIKGIILFGSVAAGSFDEKSDIDIFIDIWDNSKKSLVEKKVDEQLKKFENVASRVWYSRNIKNNFSIIVGSLNSPMWKNIRYDIISNGMVLYGKFEQLPGKIQHSILINFSLNKLKPSDKMKFIRELYGYELKKNGKTYKQIGLLYKYNGVKLSSNSILVPLEKNKEFRKVFSKFRITPEIREVWMK